jgi:hypothetical protein
MRQSRQARERVVFFGPLILAVRRDADRVLDALYHSERLTILSATLGGTDMDKGQFIKAGPVYYVIAVRACFQSGSAGDVGIAANAQEIFLGR